VRAAHAAGPERHHTRRQDCERSYFTALTYPEGLASTVQPADIHDAIWGIFAAVYGGAIDPTAEGDAAMADAALPAVREALGLVATAMPARAEPLPPPAR
jgi:hypothetical protein